MELRPTSRYPSVGLSTDGSEEDEVIGPVSIDGLEVVDEQVVQLAPLDAPGRRRRRGSDHAVG